MKGRAHAESTTRTLAVGLVVWHARRYRASRSLTFAEASLPSGHAERVVP